MYIGVANNNSINNSVKKKVEENLLANTVSPFTKNNHTQKNTSAFITQNISTAISNNYQKKSQRNSTPHIIPHSFAKISKPADLLSTHNTASKNISLEDKEKTLLQTDDLVVSNIKEKQTQLLQDFAIANTEKDIYIENANTIVKNNTDKTTLVKTTLDKTTEDKTTEDKTTLDKITEDKTTEDKTNANFLIANTINSIKNTAPASFDYEENSWKEDYAFRNKPRINKLKEFGSIAYYITPSLGFRTFSQKQNNNKLAVSNASSFAAFVTNNNTDATINDVFALNLEAGAVLQYKLSKNIRLKTGLQANYTNYISKVRELAHPTQASLAATGLQNNYRSSTYTTKDGKTNLNRTTWQVSVPIGLDVKIAGNKKLKWYLGATAQPTYIMSGNAFVLSADEKNYINENALLRKWNLNTAIETFVSFKPSAAVTLHLGPQFRYQLFSSYKKAYNYTEKLYNVGVKVGITTNF
jgi:hypothetical protein